MHNCFHFQVRSPPFADSDEALHILNHFHTHTHTSRYVALSGTTNIGPLELMASIYDALCSYAAGTAPFFSTGIRKLDSAGIPPQTTHAHVSTAPRSTFIHVLSLHQTTHKESYGTGPVLFFTIFQKYRIRVAFCLLLFRLAFDKNQPAPYLCFRI